MPKSRARSAEHHHDCPGSDEYAANQSGRGQPFAQQQPREDHHQGHAELVQRRNARSGSELECAEITQPGKPRSQSGERKEKHGALVEQTDLAVLSERQSNAPRENDHDAGAQCCGQVRVHVCHTNLCQ